MTYLFLNRLIAPVGGQGPFYLGAVQADCRPASLVRPRDTTSAPAQKVAPGPLPAPPETGRCVSVAFVPPIRRPRDLLWKVLSLSTRSFPRYFRIWPA